VTRYYHDDGSDDDELPSPSKLEFWAKQKGRFAVAKPSPGSTAEKTIDPTLDDNLASFSGLETGGNQG
jgi:hypothetical protein